MQELVEQLIPTREGHFVFESGHHGRIWLDLERLFLHPARVQPLAEAIAHRLRGHQIAAVCGPLVEGAFVSLLVASSLRLPMVLLGLQAGADAGERPARPGAGAVVELTTT